MRRCCDDATSCLPLVLQEDKTNRRADDIKTLKFIFPLPVNFLLLLPTTLHTSRCLSMLPRSLAVMLLWLHSKGYAVYPPSLPVTPPPPPVTHTHTNARAHTHTRTHASSVPGPVNNIPSAESPTYQQFAFAKRALW